MIKMKENLGTTPEKSVLVYMAEKHTTIINDYKAPEGTKFEYCVSIAEEIFLILTLQGKIPYIAKIHNKTAGKNITPRAFDGRILWGEHHVCCENDMIYDPMVSAKPITLEDYLKTSFEEEVELTPWHVSLANW